MSYIPQYFLTDDEINALPPKHRNVELKRKQKWQAQINKQNRKWGNDIKKDDIAFEKWEQKKYGCKTELISNNSDLISTKSFQNENQNFPKIETIGNYDVIDEHKAKAPKMKKAKKQHTFFKNFNKKISKHLFCDQVITAFCLCFIAGGFPVLIEYLVSQMPNSASIFNHDFSKTWYWVYGFSCAFFFFVILFMEKWSQFKQSIKKDKK